MALVVILGRMPAHAVASTSGLDGRTRVDAPDGDPGIDGIRVERRVLRHQAQRANLGSGSDGDTDIDDGTKTNRDVASQRAPAPSSRRRPRRCGRTCAPRSR